MFSYYFEDATVCNDVLSNPPSLLSNASYTHPQLVPDVCLAGSGRRSHWALCKGLISSSRRAHIGGRIHGANHDCRGQRNATICKQAERRDGVEDGMARLAQAWRCIPPLLEPSGQWQSADVSFGGRVFLFWWGPGNCRPTLAGQASELSKALVRSAVDSTVRAPGQPGACNGWGLGKQASTVFLHLSLTSPPPTSDAVS